MSFASMVLLRDTVDVVEMDEEEDAAGPCGVGDCEREGEGRASTALLGPAAGAPIFSFTLRTRIGSVSVFKGPWAAVPVSEMAPQNRALIEKELTLRPFTMIAGVRKLQPAMHCFQFKESGGERYLLVPRAYFTDRFGLPAIDETCLGQAISPALAFQGQLRDERQKMFVRALISTMLERKKTIALGSAEPGCGKTVMFLYLWSVVLRRKCLVIVHGLPIVAQWIAAARRFCPSSRIGIIHQNTWQIRNRDIVIASSDTMAARAGHFSKKLWHEFGVVCFDEAHHIMASTFLNIYLNCMHARYCVSLTGTPYRKDGLTHAMAFLTGPNAASMKNTDSVHVRVVQFTGGLKSFVAHKYGPGKGKPNEAAMMSAFVEDEVRTCLIARIVRACVLAGRKCLVLCARNELRQAIRMLVQESFDKEGRPLSPHTHRPLVKVGKGGGGGNGGGGEKDGGPPAGAALGAVVFGLADAYDTIWLEEFRVVPSGPLERSEMVRKITVLERKASEEQRDLARTLAGGIYPPKVVPDLEESPEHVNVPWVEELNAGDDYLSRQNKYHARSILATYVMAREALDVPGLDTLILATPSSDVRQAVGRIRRTGRGGGGGGGGGEADRQRPLIQTPCALVIDLVDMFHPFQRWGDVRKGYYRSERFAISTATVAKDTDPWDAADQ